MTLDAWNYRRYLSISDTALTNRRVRVTLTTSNFDFTKVSFRDGRDIRIHDGVGTRPHALVHYRPGPQPGQRAVIDFLAADTSRQHFLYYQNAAATEVGDPASTWTHGTDFSSGSVNDLTARTSGSGATSVLSAASSPGDSRYYQYGTRPATALDFGFGAGVAPTGYGYVRELRVLKDTDGKVVVTTPGGVSTLHAVLMLKTSDDATADIGYLTSTDSGKTWSYQGLLFSRGGAGTDDEAQACSADWIKKLDGTYLLVYLAIASGSGTRRIIKRTSSSISSGWSTPSASDRIASGSGFTGLAVSLYGVPCIVYDDSDASYIVLFEGVLDEGGGTHPNNKFYIWGTRSADSGATWSPLNSGGLILDGGGVGNWDIEVANPSFLKQGSTWVLLYNGRTANGNPWHLGCATTTTAATSWNNAAWTRQTGTTGYAIPGNGGTYGVETSTLVKWTDGNSVLTYVQAFSGASTTGSIYSVTWYDQRGALLSETAAADAAFYAVQLAASGSFVAETNTGLLGKGDATGGRTFSIAIVNSASVPTAGGSTASPWQNDVILRVRRVTATDASSPAKYLIEITDTANVLHWWTGSAWSTSATFLAGNREDAATMTITDDGTNYVIAITKSSDGSSLYSASVAKSGSALNGSNPKSFSSGRALVVGEPHTDVYQQGGYVRSVAQYPYNASEPTVTVGQENPNLPGGVYPYHVGAALSGGFWDGGL